MIKLIALDLDDTLLMSDCTIPDEAIDVLREAGSMGVRAVIATGRIFPSARIYAAQISSDCPIICYNGSLIADSAGNIIDARMLSPELMHRVAVFCRERGLYLQLYNSRHQIVIEKDCPEFRIDPDSRTTSFIELGDLTEAVLEPSPKMMINAPRERIALIQPELAAEFGNELYIAGSKDYLLEMMPKGVSKKNTLQGLADRLDIKNSEVMVCGDNTNDIEMAEWAGCGVAVANAVPRLKEIADYVASAERSYGVIEAVRKFVLQ